MIFFGPTILIFLLIHACMSFSWMGEWLIVSKYVSKMNNLLSMTTHNIYAAASYSISLKKPSLIHFVIASIQTLQNKQMILNIYTWGKWYLLEVSSTTDLRSKRPCFGEFDRESPHRVYSLKMSAKVQIPHNLWNFMYVWVIWGLPIIFTTKIILKSKF